MKILAISDTHGLHDQLTELPEADMIIHAGDVSKRGTESEIMSFLEWYSSLPYQHKIFVAGNHDFYLESVEKEKLIEQIPDNLIYLEDQGVTIEGIHIWGSPVQPWFFDWAFQKQRGAELQAHWQKIPKEVDILVTHGPPQGRLDRVHNGKLAGCADLLERIRKTEARVHIFGHIHEAAGEMHADGVHYINAAVVNLTYNNVRSGVVFECCEK